MKFISFALFGADPKYRRGMMDNVRAASSFFPGWKLLIYCDRVNHDALMLEGLGPDVECILQKERSEGVEGAAWRFLATLRPDAEVVLFRDADSIFTRREQAAVQEWLASDKDTHIIRDHPFHKSPVMAGMFGVKGAGIQHLADRTEARLSSHRLTEYGGDQVFLTQDFYPKAKRTAMVHTSCVRYFPEYTRPLPPDQPGEHFIGAYAFLTDAEHEEFDRIRREAPPVTLLPEHWGKVPVVRKLYRKFHQVERIKYGCRWCL